MKKIVFLIFSCCYSISVFSISLQEVLLKIAVDGNTEDGIFGNGILITDDIVVTVNHLVDRDKNYTFDQEKFLPNETVEKNQGKTYLETCYDDDRNKNVYHGFKPVLLVNNHKNVFVIKKEFSGYFHQKVLKIVSYNQNEPFEKDPVQILLLSSNKPILPDNLRARFFNEEWSTLGKILPSLKIEFSTINKSNETWKIFYFFWDRKEPTLAFAYPEGKDFIISPLHVACGMSGGGIFSNGLLVGIMSACTYSCEISLCPSSKKTIYESLFSRYSWSMDIDTSFDGLKFKSIQGFSGAIVKELNFEDLKRAISLS